MSDSEKAIVARHEPAHGTWLSYSVGFGLSVALTLIAFGAVELHLHGHFDLTRDQLIGGIIGLALVQFLVQLFFFLHLGQETKPRWKLAVFAMMILTVGILVIGSLWIMSNLNYHMTTEQTNTYLRGQDGL